MPVFRQMLQHLTRLTEKGVTRQFSRYLITGFTAFGIEYGLYILLYRFLNTHYIIASTTVYVVTFWFVFLVNRYWSFQSQGDIKKQVIQYGLLFGFNLVMANIVLMYVFIDMLGISAYAAPIVKMACVVCWNFLIYKYMIYK